MPFSQGRLTAITRDGASIDYAYDRFGRVTQDGALIYGYDENGNRTSIEYPCGVVATYAFDFADRHSSLTVDDGSGPQAVVTSASYLPSGPLTALTLGNGVTENRLFDARYFPDSIEVMTPRSHLWDYTTDQVGNITSIVETEDCVPMLTLANRTLVGEETFVSCDHLSADPDVTVAAGADAVFRAGNSIGLGNGFSVASGATFTAATGSAAPKVSSYSYGYQDVRYFLTSATGSPWGSLTWTYDRIGNRLSENRNGSIDSYTYVSNGSGNTPILTQAGSETYTTGPAGHVTSITDGVGPINLPIDDAGRVAGFERPVAGAETAFAYDGRGFLRRSEELLEDGPDVGFTEPTYSTEGVLLALHRQLSPSDPEERASVFYFAGRPVAELRQEIDGPSEWLFLSTDHLGTPMLAADITGVEVWHGPLEPFGADFHRGSSESALVAGVFLRFPGQWEDETWEEVSMETGIYYNLNRSYQPQIGKYTRTDPLGLRGGPHPYAYASSRPLSNVDPLGLEGKPPDSKWCDDLQPPCPDSCDPQALQAALTGAEELMSAFCKYKEQQIKPPETLEGKTVGGVDGGRGWFVPQGDPCRDACICAHEETHVQQLNDPRIEQMIMDGIPIQQIANTLECEAYGTSVDCLNAFIAGTPFRR